MTKAEIISQCTKGISEDISGNLYQLYDAERLYDAVVEKACIAIHYMMVDGFEFVLSDNDLIMVAIRNAMND